MTLRRKSREFALQMLFEWDVTRQKASRVEQLFWKSARAADSTRKFANQLFEGAIAEAEVTDKLVQKLPKTGSSSVWRPWIEVFYVWRCTNYASAPRRQKL
jgi:transcription termination factor NusB